MTTQQVCSPAYQRGFINVAGNLSAQSITTQPNISPFTASFAPRNVPPSAYGTFIDESNQNTILYNSKRYSIVPGGTQISNPAHIGLNLQQSNQPSLELFFTFYTNESVPVSEPKVIILAVPIYSTYENKHAAYLRQFIDSDKYPAASIQTIFFENKEDKSQSSIAYNTSVQLVDTNKKPVKCINIRAFYFPGGIRMSGQDFYMFKNIITQSEKSAILNYILPYQITEGNSIVTSYDQLTNQITAVSSSFNLPVSQITVADIGNKLEYFKPPIALSGSKDFSSSCPYYKTDQYKCVPFHRLKDLSGNEVIKDANTMADLLKTQDEQNSQGMSVDVKWAFVYMGVVIGVAVLIIFLGWIVRLLTSSNPPGRATAVVAAAGATAAVATATATPVAAMPALVPASAAVTP